MRTTLVFNVLSFQYAVHVLAQAGGKPLKPCSGCHLRLGESVHTYPNPVVQVGATVTAQVIPHVTEFEDGSRSTSYSTITQDGNSAPTDLPLTWQVSGLTLTYPTTYLLFDKISGGPIIPASAPTAVCTSSIASLKLPAALNSQSLLFPFSGPVQTGAAANAVVGYLNQFPEVVAQFDGTNLRNCILEVGQFPQQTPVAAAAPVTKTSVAVFTETVAPIVVRSPSNNIAPPNVVINAAIPSIAVPNVGNVLAAVGQTSPQQGVNRVNIGSSQVEVSQGPNSAVVLDKAVTIAPGAAVSFNGIPVSLLPSGGSLVIGGSTTVPASPTFTGFGAGSFPGGSTGSQAGGLPLLPGMPFLKPGGPFPTGFIPPMFALAGQNFAPVTALYVAGQYLMPGSQIIVSNTTLSLPTIAPESSSVIVINGLTSTLPNVQRQVLLSTDSLGQIASQTSTTPPSASITEPPALVINGRSFPAVVENGKTLYPISPGQTVTPGKQFTLGGTRCSLDAGGTALVVGSSTYAMQSTLAWVPVKAQAVQSSVSSSAAGLLAPPVGRRGVWACSSIVGILFAGMLVI